MRKERWVAFALILALILVGCSTLKQDQRYSNSGFDELSKGNYPKAEEHLKKALEANPNNPYALLNMGVVYQNTGRKVQARKMYEKVLSLEEGLKNKTARRSNKDWARGETLGAVAKRNLETL